MHQLVGKLVTINLFVDMMQKQKTIDPNDDNDLDAVGKDSNVVIEKENQKAVIRYVSTNGNRVLTTDEVTGKSGEAIAYSTTRSNQ